MPALQRYRTLGADVAMENHGPKRIPIEAAHAILPWQHIHASIQSVADSKRVTANAVQDFSRRQTVTDDIEQAFCHPY
jgi:hypothetical protein